MEQEQEHIYWVGPRNSDALFTNDLFYGSITIFGDGESFGEGKGKNLAYSKEAQKRRNHNVNNEAENAFFFDTIENIIQNDKSARFLFYNPNAVFFIFSKDGRRLDTLNTDGQFLCLNDEKVAEDANNKRTFAKLLTKEVSLLPHQDNVRSANGDYNSLLRSFGLDVSQHPRFIFQAPISSGGNGTFIVSKTTDESVIRKLKQNESFMVSVYQEKNVPVNIHAIIFRDHIALTPGSVQIIREGSNNCGEHRLLYRGADFIAYRKLPESVRAKFEKDVKRACEIYRDRGYLGVCGIDGIVCGDDVYLLEMNNRFQASTSLINRALSEKKLPSVQKLNISAFSDTWEKAWSKTFPDLKDVEVNYSNFSFEATDEICTMHAEHIYNTGKKILDDRMRSVSPEIKSHIVGLDDDGLCWRDEMEDLAYLFRIVFDKSITSLGPEKTMFLNENIVEPNKKDWYDKLDITINRDALSGESMKQTRDYCLRLKIALLVQGVRISKAANDLLLKKGGIRPATNNAVDLRIDFHFYSSEKRYLIINAPTDVDFVEFSPFLIQPDGDRLILSYYDTPITEVSVYPIDPVPVIKTVNGDYVPRYTSPKKLGVHPVRYDEIGFMSTDRLRVHVTNHCAFKKKDESGKYLGCKFCNIQASEDVFDLENVEEVVKEYCSRAEEIKLTHFLVGGQTAKQDDENLIKIIRLIRQYARFADIYAMITPHSPKTLMEMYEAGLNQLSCNVEVFDDDIAKQYMPGKRSVTRDEYKECLSYATTLFGRSGNVRTMVILGLEPDRSLLSGIREFVDCGIQPILSIFRPLPGTPMEDMQAPPMLYLLRIYNTIQDICRSRGLYLGPYCVNCQNNTLALPVWLEEGAKKG